MSVKVDKFHQDGINRDPKVQIDKTAGEDTDKLIEIWYLLIVLEAEHQTG